MNLTENELIVLVRSHAKQIVEGQMDMDMDRPRPLRKGDLVAKIERMLQLAKELP